MGWKKKEKPLTPEQAIEAAKKELTPLWFNSEPLLAAIRVPNGASVLPLNSKFVEASWVYFFIDPTDFSGDRALLIAREWYRRYAEHKMSFMVVFRVALPFVKSAPDLLKKKLISFPAACDHEGLIAAAFGVQEWPAVVIQSGPEEIARGSGADWSIQSEEKLQHFLRRTNAGLSLELPFDLKHSVKGQTRIDFGTLSEKPLKALSETIQLTGNWTETEDSIFTQDPTATATVKSKSPVVGMVAQVTTERGTTRVMTESMDGALGAEFFVEGASMDEMGRTIIRIQTFGLHYLMQNLPANRRTFKFTFPDSHHTPIRIFGFRFGSS